MIFQSFQQKCKKLNPHPLGLEVSLVGIYPAIVEKEECLIKVVIEPGNNKDFELQLRNIREAEPEKDGSPPGGIVVERVGLPSHGGLIQLQDTHGVTGDTIQGIRI